MVENSPTKKYRRSIDSENLNILDLLPIDMLQKDAIISDTEVKEHPILTLKVSLRYSNIHLFSIFSFK